MEKKSGRVSNRVKGAEVALIQRGSTSEVRKAKKVLRNHRTEQQQNMKAN